MPFSNRTRSATGIPVSSYGAFWQSVERRHEADIQRIRIRTGDGFTDFCLCDAHVLIRSIGMHSKILEETADGISGQENISMLILAGRNSIQTLVAGVEHSAHFGDDLLADLSEKRRSL